MYSGPARALANFSLTVTQNTFGRAYAGWPACVVTLTSIRSRSSIGLYGHTVNSSRSGVH